MGAGLARLVEGLGARTDVEVHTVEVDPALALTGDRPSFVHQHLGDVLDLFDSLGTFDLIFAAAPGGKWHGLERTVAALTPDGLLLVDDMTPPALGQCRARGSNPSGTAHPAEPRRPASGRTGLEQRPDPRRAASLTGTGAAASC